MRAPQMTACQNRMPKKKRPISENRNGSNQDRNAKISQYQPQKKRQKGLTGRPKKRESFWSYL